MRIRDSIVLAYESLTTNRARSFLSVLGVTIGVAAVIGGIVLGVGNRESIMNKLATSGADILWFYNKPEEKWEPFQGSLVYKPEVSITSEDVEFIKKQCPLIKEITPYIYSPASLRYRGKYHTIKALGFMYPHAAEDLFAVKIIKGRQISNLDVRTKAKVCIIEKSDFSDQIFGKEIPIGKYILVEKDKYKIVGVTDEMRFELTYPERLFILFPSSSLQETLGIRKYSAVMLTVKNIQDITKAKSQLSQILAQRFGIDSELYISEYALYVQTALEVLDLLTIIIIGIAVISLSVGGVGIMNAMLTMVMEQTREIGIAKAIGAKKGSILFLFLSQAVMLTFSGGMLGIIMGLGISWLVTSYIGIPFIVTPYAIPVGFVLSVAVGIISGSYPAKRAAELDPVETLRQL